VTARTTAPAAAPARSAVRAAAPLVLGVLLVAANLRPTLTSVGPVLPELQADLGLRATGAGALGALPLLTFAAAAPLVPRLARRLGAEPLLVLALAVLVAGTVLRSVSGPAGVFAGTVVLAAGIGAANVLLPVVVKTRLPERVGLVTSWYAATLTVAAALASGVAVPIAQASAAGWRAALGCWSVLALAALLAWLPAARRAGRARRSADGPAAALGVLPWRSPLAWQVTAYMGLQSLGFYAVVAWLPSLLVDRGASPTAAGVQLLVLQLAGLVAGLAVPVVLRASADQRALAVTGGALFLVGFAGLALVPEWSWVWTVLTGAGAGSSFTLSLTLLALRSSGAAGAAALSAMAQSVGYLVAAAGPVAVGALHDATGGWTASLLLLVVVAAAQVVVGLGAGRARLVR